MCARGITQWNTELTFIHAKGIPEAPQVERLQAEVSDGAQSTMAIVTLTLLRLLDTHRVRLRHYQQAQVIVILDVMMLEDKAST